MRRVAAFSAVVGLAIVLLVVGASFGQAGDQELRALVPRIVLSWETFDISQISKYYASDANLTYFDLAPMKYNDWSEYAAGVQKAFFEPNKSLKFKVNDDLQVHSHGALAWATFTFGADVVSKQGAASHLDGRWTMVLEKRPKGWIVVHEHVSVPLSGS
jgi:ketosteroid isomerase-like protein